MDDSKSSPPRENILGVGVSAINMQATLKIVADWITSGVQSYVCVTGVHGIMESQRWDDIRHIHNDAGLVTPDGAPLAWLLRLAGHSEARQVCGPELMPNLFVAGQEYDCLHFLYGTNATTLQQLQQRLAVEAPRARIVGSYAPPYRPLTEEEDEAVIALINRCRPDIVWVGLSTPKQERWMAAHRQRLSAPVLIGVGAAFDINAGLVRRAPKILRRFGLEWAYRMAQDPRRLGGRYLRNNPAFIAKIFLQKAGLLTFPLHEGYTR